MMAVFLLALAIGIGIASFVFLNTVTWWMMALGTVALIGVGYFFRRYFLKWSTIVIALFFIFGVGRVLISARTPIIFYQGDVVSVRGEVTDLPIHTSSSVRYEIVVRGVWKDGSWRTAHHTIQVLAREPSDFSYGDVLSLTCTFQKPTGFDEGRLRAQGADAVCRPSAGIERVGTGAGFLPMRFVMRLHERAVHTIDTLYQEPFSGLLAGLVLGEHGSLRKELRAALQRTGTTHMIAISGFNVAMITSALFTMCLLIFGRRFALAITMTLLVMFVVLVGAGASVVRAALMGATVLFARHFGRPVHSAHLLLLVGIIMLIANPWLLLYDLGFILSFAATCGLLFFAPSFKKRFENIPEAYGMRDTLADTLAAIAATLPFTLFAFGTVSFIAPLANLLVLFLVPIATWMGFVALFFAWIPIVGQFIVWFLGMLLTAILGYIEMLSRLPFASFNFPFAQGVAVCAGAAIFLWAYHLNKKPSRVS